jgi:predicted nucleotidyltransferase
MSIYTALAGHVELKVYTTMTIKSDYMDEATQSDLGIIKDAILQLVDNVKAIYLFGSVARGTEKKGSDYDILILVQKSPNNLVNTIADILNIVEERVRRPVEPFIMEIKDLDYPSPILYEVYYNHSLLYGENIIGEKSDVVRKIKPYVKDGTAGYHVEH